MRLSELSVGQRATFSNVDPKADDEEVMVVERRAHSFYGDCGKYDFERKTAEQTEAVLALWGYTIFQRVR